MYLNKITTLLFLFFITKATFAQTDSAQKENHFLKFKKEPGGKVCVNGLEKLEIALSSDKSFTGVNQLHYYGPGRTQGRMFLSAIQENKTVAPVHFFEATFDLTVGEFPLHLGYTLGTDQFGAGNQSFSGPTLTSYWSDLKKFHHYFHIMRTSASLLSISQHRENSLGNDSVVKCGKQMEYSFFFQTQPFHLTNNLSIFSEGLGRFRKDKNLMEFEIGVRHKKIFDELIGIGVKTEWEEFHFHSMGAVLRFNISNPNPRHL